MLAIEKQRSVLHKTVILTGTFMIGLVGSTSALYAIDPKNNTSDITSETKFLKQRDSQSAEQAEQSPASTSTSAGNARVTTWTSGQNQNYDAPQSAESTEQVQPSQSAPKDSAEPTPPPASEPQESSTTDTPSDSKPSGGVLSNLLCICSFLIKKPLEL